VERLSSFSGRPAKGSTQTGIGIKRGATMRERTVLALALFKPSLIPALIEKCDDSFEWKDDNCKKLFERLVYKQKKKEECSYFILQNELSGVINGSWWESLLSSIQGIPPGSYENEFFSLINAIKSSRGAIKVQAKFNTLLKSGIPIDWDEIIEIAESAKGVELRREKADMDTAFSEYQEMLRCGDGQITLGYPGIDNCFHGLRNGEILMIAGRPGVGKTFLMLNMIENVIPQAGEGIGFFSLEMPKSSIVERLIQNISGMSDLEIGQRIREGDFLEEDFKKTFKPIKLYSQTYTTTEIRSIINRDKLRVVFIDALGLIRSTIDSPYRRISQIIEDLKQCAKDKGVIFVIIHHLSRGEEHGQNDGAKPVKLSHLRDSGKIEEVIDFCIGAYRPELALTGEEKWRDVLVAELIKNRRGKGNRVDCDFNKTSGKIREQDARTN